MLVLSGTAAAIALLVRARRMVVGSAMGLLVLTFWVFIARGGVVLPFYLVPILPFLALSPVIVVWAVLRRAADRLSGRRDAAALIVGVAGALLVGVTAAQYAVLQNAQAFTADPTAGQRQAVAWVRSHLPADSRLIVDTSMWMSLRVPAGSLSPIYPQPQWHWKVDNDPKTRSALLSASNTSEYIVTDLQMIQNAGLNGFPIVTKALNESRAVARFDTGWPVEVRHVVPGYQSADFAEIGGTRSADATPPTCMTGR